MSRVITGPLEYPDGTQLPRGLLRFVGTRNSYSADGSTPIYTQYDVRCDNEGQFRQAINFGQYRVLLQPFGAAAWLTLGQVKVTAGGTVPLGEILEFTGSTLETTYPDVATRTWVAATYSPGTASSLDITDFDPGYAPAKSYLRVDREGKYLTPSPERAQQYYHSQAKAHLRNRSLG